MNRGFRHSPIIRTMFVLCMVIMLFTSSLAGADTLETGRTASDIVRDTFTAEDGLVRFYEDCLEKNGPFRFWTIGEKYWFSSMLPELMTAEEERMKQYHPEWLVSVPFADSILTWGYAEAEPWMISQEDALGKARDVLLTKYESDCSEDQVSVNLYTGHWAMESFADPYWVFRFYEKARKHAEVWVNARTGDIPEHQALEAEREAKRQFALNPMDGHLVAGEKVTVDMIDPDEVSTFFDGKDQTWHVVIRILDSWWEIVLDDLQLKKLETKTSNG